MTVILFNIYKQEDYDTFYYNFFIILFVQNLAEAKGQATDWQLGLQEAASPLMAELISYTILFSGLLP